MKEEIYRCDYCRRIIPKNRVVEFPNSEYTLLLCDYLPSKFARPTLKLMDIALCLDCLVPYFQKWVNKIKGDSGYII